MYAIEKRINETRMGCRSVCISNFINPAVQFFFRRRRQCICIPQKEQGLMKTARKPLINGFCVPLTLGTSGRRLFRKQKRSPHGRRTVLCTRYCQSNCIFKREQRRFSSQRALIRVDFQACSTIFRWRRRAQSEELVKPMVTARNYVNLHIAGRLESEATNQHNNRHVKKADENIYKAIDGMAEEIKHHTNAHRGRKSKKRDAGRAQERYREMGKKN